MSLAPHDWTEPQGLARLRRCRRCNFRDTAVKPDDGDCPPLLRERLEKALQLVEELWAQLAPGGWCYVCGARPHAPDCQLAEALAWRKS